MIAPFRTKRANFGHSDKKVGVCNCLGECNRYASIVRPQYFNVTGQRASGSIILLNGGPPSYQQGSSGLYFRKEVAANVSGRYTATTVTANSVTTDAWNQYVAPNPEPYTYDADGNLLTDGRWIYTWDAENRLTSATSQPQSSPPLAVNGVRAEFTYDGLSRRIEKRTYQNSSIAPSWVLNNWELYAYDGWNLVTTARRNNDASVVRRVGLYCWGPDLGSAPLGATTWQAAGGVGGFLFSVDYSNSAVTYTGLPAPPADPTDDHYFACQDRLGNITGIMRATSGQTALESVLDYDPFGREIRATGTAARRLPFHFSSKFTDFETGLAYYGYRYYDPRNGRWLSRDPLAETGGLNLYVAMRNAAPRTVDILGLDPALFDPSGRPPGDANRRHVASWKAEPCKQPCGGFRQVVTRYIQRVTNAKSGPFQALDNPPFFDNQDSRPSSPLNPFIDPPRPFYDTGSDEPFEDDPTTLPWNNPNYEVCRVCVLQGDITNKQIIISVGPCKQWKAGGPEDLADLPDDFPSPDFQEHLRSRYPGISDSANFNDYPYY